MKSLSDKKLRRIRRSILKYLNLNGWPWNKGFSQILDRIDSRVFGMGQEIHERK
jgi:hypothetical protein